MIRHWMTLQNPASSLFPCFLKSMDIFINLKESTQLQAKDVPEFPRRSLEEKASGPEFWVTLRELTIAIALVDLIMGRLPLPPPHSVSPTIYQLWPLFAWPTPPERPSRGS